jgi:hypothetical protein
MEFSTKQCMGERRYEGIFTLGGRVDNWERCKNVPVAILTVQDERLKEGSFRTTVCTQCWNEGLEGGAVILKAEPIVPTGE